VQSIKGRANGKISCIVTIDYVNIKPSSDFKKLVGICPNASSIRAKMNEAVALLQKYIGRRIISHHCITHQQVFCSTSVLKYMVKES